MYAGGGAACSAFFSPQAEIRSRAAACASAGRRVAGTVISAGPGCCQLVDVDRLDLAVVVVVLQAVGAGDGLGRLVYLVVLVGGFGQLRFRFPPEARSDSMRW